MERMRFYSIWLALICIILFIIQFIFPTFTNAFILNNQGFYQPWRFLTAIFLHGSPIHLIYNLFALILFGFILEKIIGSKKFILIFFISGIIANLIAVNFYDSSLGASGAIYGIIGALTILRPRLFVWAFSIPMPLFLASVIWAIGDIIQTFVPSNIGTIAHLSGLVIGIIFGIILRKKYSVPERKVNKINIPDSYLNKWEDHYLK